jgi:hypothetical protein
MDSIDVYLEKKRKRAEELTASVKKARTVLHEVQEAVTKLKSRRTNSMVSFGGKISFSLFLILCYLYMYMCKDKVLEKCMLETE